MTSNNETIYGRESAEMITARLGLPVQVAQPTLVAYRSVGIGVFGAVMRVVGMPLEKIALYMNSSQVSTGAGKGGQFAQAARLTFQQGYMAPYRVVGTSSLTAWFLQYSVMGIAFQFFDQTLSSMLGVRPVYYGKELMEPPTPTATESKSLDYQMKSGLARLLSPILAAGLESGVSNKAEVQRFFGPAQFAKMKIGGSKILKPLTGIVGPAFAPNAMRNVIMCQTSFLLTPVTYKLYFPQEHKSKTSLFWYGLGLNVFIGNTVAITQQALWGRSLDYLKEHGQINYRAVVRQGLAKDGFAAFFTGPKWFSRVLMNAPAQGTLPWFYNEVLPLGESFILTAASSVYEPLYVESPSTQVLVDHTANRITLKHAQSLRATTFK